MSKIQCTILLLIACLNIGCRDNGINDSDKRIENNVWFIDKTSGKGRWVPYGDSTTLDDGSYTAFYSTGKIREKGKIKNKAPSDTVYFFDINERLIKYTFILEETSVHYYIHEGPFKAYSKKAELIVEGIVKDHTLEQEKWYGPFEHFLKIMGALAPAVSDHKKFSEELATDLMAATNTADSIVPYKKIEIIDSLYIVALASVSKAIAELSRIGNRREIQMLKNTSIQVMKGYYDNLYNEFNKVLSLTKMRLSPDNINTILSIISKLYKTKSDQEILLNNITQEFQSIYVNEDEQITYLQKTIFKEWPSVFRQQNTALFH